MVAPQMEPRGTSEYTLNLVRQYRKLGVEAAVFCVPGPMTGAVEAEGIPVQTFAHLESRLFPLTEGRRFEEAVRHYAPQIVHLQSTRVARVVGLLRRRLRLPIALTVHWRPSRAALFRRLSTKLAGIIATCHGVREELVNQCRVDKGRITVIHNGVDVGQLAGREIRPVLSSGVPVVGSVGPVEADRGQGLFVRAAARLVGSGRKREFVVAGRGRKLPRIRKLVGRLGLSECFTFATDFRKYEDILEALDVVVQPAMVDISGFSVLEAMLHGRPVVAFNTGAACEIIEEGRTGLLVPRGDVEALARCIREITDRPETARRMGDQARARVGEKFNIEEIARQTLNYYGSLLAG